LALVCLLVGLSPAGAAEEEGKFRVAVGDLVISQALSPAATKTVANSSLMANIENALRNGRKFEVLTRRASAMEATRKEQALAASDLSSGNAAQSGQFSNAQAIVNVEVLKFSFGRSSNPVPNIANKYTVSDSCNIELSVQILDTRTTSILASFPIKASSGTAPEVVNSVGSANTAVMTRTLESAAGYLANRVADTIFPITVVTVRGKQIWINRGDDSGMKLGEIFEVFEPGEELFDPQTKESLGTTEALMGKAKVTRINPKVSIVEMTAGNAAEVEPGFILRRPATK
jgi:hypothetical protein